MLTMLILTPLNYVSAGNEDDELSIMAAEQKSDNETNIKSEDEVETFENEKKTEPIKNPVNDKNKTDKTDKNSSSSKVNKNDKNKEKSVNKNNDKSSKSKPDSKKIKNSPLDTSDIVNVSNSDNLKNDINNKNNTANNNSVKTMPSQNDIKSPIKSYANFNEAAKKVGYIPLYIPKKSGFSMNSISVIDDKMVEIRYGRRWEPNVTLAVRTAKRAQGEEPTDISGVAGVNWKVDLTSGMTIYIARINDNSNVAVWAAGQYTFAALAENLSFAAFHSLIVDELVDLCNHYFISLQ